MELQHSSTLEKLNDLAQRALEINKTTNAQMEISLTNGFERSIEVRANSIAGVQQQTKTKVTVRVYLGKKLGVATATSLSPQSIEETVRTAHELAKLAPEDDKFVSLPEPSSRKPAKIKGLYDEALATMDPSTVVETMEDLIQGAKETHQQANTRSRLNINLSEKVIANSLGILTETMTTSLNTFAFVSIPLSPQNVGVGSEFYVDRQWPKDFSFHDLGKTAAEKATKMLGAKIGPSKKLPVILDERATFQTLAQIFGFGVNGYTVMTGISYFADKIGAQLANEELTLWDDPHVDAGASSTAFDYEGVPTTKVNILEKGVLQSYVTDSYTAQALGLENTGNAGPGMRSSIPRPKIHQLQIASGNVSKDELYEDLKEGIILESGVGPAGGSPQISSQINRGFYVENGEIQYPLKNTMLGSSVYEFLSGITGISKELRKEFGHQAPTIMVKEVSIAGAGKKKNSGPTIVMRAD